MKKKQSFAYLAIYLLVTAGCHHKTADNRTDELVQRSDINIPNADAKKLFSEGLDDIESKKYTDAKTYFLKADSISPNSPLILNALGNLSAQSNNDSMTESYFARALNIDSSFTKSYINYGVYLNNKAHYAEAVKLFNIGLYKKISNKEDEQVLYFNLANSYYLMKQKGEALKCLEEAKAIAPNSRLYQKIIDFQKQIQSGK